MKRVCVYLLLFFCVFGLMKVNVSASGMAPRPGEGGGGIEESGDGGGGGGDEPSEPPEPHIPSELAFSPKVTVLHSANAYFANSGQSVYFLPSYEDFPVDLEAALADVTTNDGVRHQFSVVYPGFFNSEVVLNSADADNNDQIVSRYQTSKKVYSQHDNSRLLNIVGYDLLLSDEKAYFYSEGGWLDGTYAPTLVGTAPLTAKTVVMDLYKAVGQYEWDIKVAYGIDDTVAVNTHPLMQQLAVDINDLIEGGIDTAEAYTAVWATRTNPDLYWLRAERDAIFDGGAHLYTKEVYIGNDVSVSFAKSQTSTVTMLEFCQLAHAIMELYGEPVVTEYDMQNAMQAYATAIPTSGMSEEAIEDIKYLVVKGIIDPTDIDYNKAVTFADIEPMLLRIADEGSRLVNRTITNPDALMTKAGFVKTDVGLLADEVDSIEEVVNPFDSDYYDYLIEAVDGKTNFYLTKFAGIDLKEQENMTEGEDGDDPYKVGSIPPLTPPLTQEEKVYAFACDKLIVRGLEDSGTESGGGYFDNLGLKEYNGRHYYHLRITRDIGSVTITYDVDPEKEELQDIKEYTLPHAEGGVYNYSEGLPATQTFDEANFSNVFLDAQRCIEDPLNMAQTESFLSNNWHWFVIRLDKPTFQNESGTTVFYEAPSADPTLGDIKVVYEDLKNYMNAGGFTPSEEHGATFYVNETQVQGSGTNPQIVVIVQTKEDMSTFLTRLGGVFDKNDVDEKGYYRHDDGTLLVAYKYLQQKHSASKIAKLSDGEGLCITTNAGNIILRSDVGCIIIGDTLYRTNELLYYQDPDGEYYINYRAMVGWSDTYDLINTQHGMIPMQCEKFTAVSAHPSTKQLISLYPKSSVNFGWMKFTKNSVVIAEGVSLTGSNPLSNYMVVMGDNQSVADTLFVWHRNGTMAPNGTIVNKTDDSSALFTQLTGLSVNLSEDFVLLAYELSRTGETYGFTYCSFDWYDAYTSGTREVGYVYKPMEFSNMNDALNEYMTGSSSVLPVVKSNTGLYYNACMTTCRDFATQTPYAAGNLPMVLESPAKNAIGKMGEISGFKVRAKNAEYDNLEVELLASPCGAFSTLRRIGNKAAGEVTKAYGRLYYGSSLCAVNSGQVTINGYVTEFGMDTAAVQTFLSKTSPTNIWIVNDYDTELGDLFSGEDGDGSLIVTEVEDMIDWDRYKFNRLVEDLDRWTSVALIFVLNILPRVAMLLFFALMLLSLIKDVKPWRMFCERVFDIYSFLSMGKMNVNTVDTKRVVFISLICLALFAIIMDGTLFNIIIWICEWFIVFYQL